MAIQIQFRRDTAANWSSANPLLAIGELGLETDTGKFKVGDGVTYWNDQVYASGIQGIQGLQGVQGISGAPSFDLDGGAPDSNYGGVTAINAGTP